MSIKYNKYIFKSHWIAKIKKGLIPNICLLFVLSINIVSNNAISQTAESTNITLYTQNKNFEQPKYNLSFLNYSHLITINNVSIISSFNTSSNSIGATNYYYSQPNTITSFTTYANSSIDILGVPIKINYNSFLNNTELLNSYSFYNIQFDLVEFKKKQQKFVDSLKSKLLSENLEFVAEYKQKLNKKALSLIVQNDTLLKNIVDTLGNKLSLVDMSEKSEKDISGTLFFTNVENELDYYKIQLEQTLKITNVQLRDSLNMVYTKKVVDAESKLLLIKKIVAIRKVNNYSKQIDSIKNMQNKALAEYNDILQNSEKYTAKITQKIKFPFLEKILYKIQSLKIGKQTVPSFNSNYNSQLISTGFNFEFKVKNCYVQFATGKFNSSTSLYSLSQSLEQRNNYQIHTPQYFMLGFRTGKLDESHKGFKITSINN